MTPRLHSLDGLRGLAALIVLVHHTMLTFPGFAAPYMSDAPAADGWVSWLTYSPLHALWEGRAAVYIFFVLSGLVLTLPLMNRERNFSWVAYYPRRLTRLYLPVWAAVALGVIWVNLVPRAGEVGSSWLEHQAVGAEWPRIIRDMTLLAGPGNLVSPLWSLRWEILFSLLLPAFVFIGVRWARFGWMLASASVVVIAIGGFTGDQALLLLPMFMLGVVLATSLPGVLAAADRSPRWLGVVLTAAAPVLLVSPWLARPLNNDALTGLLEGASAIGALVCVYVAITVPFARRFLSTRVMQWLGLISFSLYLVHEPVIISSAFLFGDENLFLAALVGGAVSVALAVLFYKVVEVPSHGLSRKVGELVQAATERKTRRQNSDTALQPDQRT